VYREGQSRAGSTIPIPVRRQHRVARLLSAAKLNWELFIHYLELFARYFAIDDERAMDRSVCAIGR